MARLSLLCLLLLTSSLHHVTSFAIHKRHSRSTDLGEALRMLERQRRQFGGDDDILASSPQLLGDRRLTIADLEPWFNAPRSSPPEENIDTEWLAKTLGLDGYGEEDDLPENPYYLQRPPPPLPPTPVKLQPTDQELDAIFGEKPEDNAEKASSAVAESSSPSKKDKEVMTDMKGDVKEETLALPEVRSDPAVVDVIEAKASESSDDVKLTKEEFKALLKAVEKLQKQAIDKAEGEIEEAGEVLAEMKEKASEAREEAKEEQKEVEAEEEVAEEEEEEEAAREGVDETPQPQPVSKEELDNLFEDKSEEV